jgi:hypothetical protein
VTSRPRQHLRRLAVRWVGDSAIPIGGVAGDRRLLRRALRAQSLGRVLVVGPGLATRQALPEVLVDVAGVVPLTEVTVCSAVRDADSLPRARWDTIVITDLTTDLSERLRAIRPACRSQARLYVLSRGGGAADRLRAAQLAELATIEATLTRRGRRLWIARISS